MRTAWDLNRSRRTWVTWLAAGFLTGLAACGPEPTVIPRPTPTPTLATAPTSSLPTATADFVTPNATPAPNELLRVYVPYRNRTGVFSLSHPDDWEVIDQSNERQLLVRFLPPIGFGSRITVDVTNQGPVAPEDLDPIIESYIQLNYVETGNYTEVSRDELADGRRQIIFLYDDRLGASGRETLYIQQTGPYFSAMRVFISDRDGFFMNEAVETIVASYSVDSLAVWGTAVAAINPAEMLLLNTYVWQDRTGITYFMGELSNASRSEIFGIEMKIAFCNSAGVVLTEVEASPGLDRIRSGRSSPFVASADDLPNDVTICLQEVSARPARPDPFYTDGLSLTAEASLNFRRQLVIRGTLNNPTLVPVNNIRVILGVYDAQAQIIGYGQREYGLDLQLDPGQSVPFEYIFEEIGGTADRFTTLAQGTVVRASNPSLVAPTSTP